jgi:acetyl-CoA carboxylase biotin carboxyl carrier protein
MAPSSNGVKEARKAPALTPCGSGSYHPPWNLQVPDLAQVGSGERCQASEAAFQSHPEEVQLLDFSEIKKLVQLVERADIEEIEIEEEGRRIRVRKTPAKSEADTPLMVPLASPAAMAQVAAPATAAAPAPATTPAPEAKPAKEEAPVPAGEEAPPGTQTIDAPMVGTFYRAPSPDADPFVKLGGEVDPDTVVCIVEAMKVMNEIKAGVTGKITEILIENGNPVEYGQAMFRVAAS